MKYLVYSHAHFDHIAGGKPLKDQGAIVVAHKNAKTHFEWAKKQGALLDSVVLPDEVVDNKKVISLGGTTLELIYVGRNHSDSSLVMRLPKEKLIFVVDFIPIESLPYRDMPDNVSPIEYEESIKKVLALDWDRMIPGHPNAGGRLGTKKDAQDQLNFLQELSAEVKKMAPTKCIDAAMKEIKLSKYEKWASYEQYLPGNISVIATGGPSPIEAKVKLKQLPCIIAGPPRNRGPAIHIIGSGTTMFAPGHSRPAHTAPVLTNVRC